jgi:hypothetical protein
VEFRSQACRTIWKKPDVETILFLIGLQETGFEAEKISKEQKQDLMHVAVCTLLQPSGYFILEGKDPDNYHILNK